MYYNGEHSIRFYPIKNDYYDDPLFSQTFDSGFALEIAPDTWKSWHLVPTGKVVFQPPEKDMNLLKIPGRNRLINTHEYTFGRPVFGNRTGSIEFALSPDYISYWPAIYSEMLTFFQGQKRRAVLRDDRSFFYEGWFNVSDLSPGEYWDTVSIEYDLLPCKYERYVSDEPWLWDDFDFRQGIIRDYRNVLVDTDRTLSLDGIAETIVPLFSGAESWHIYTNYAGPVKTMRDTLEAGPIIVNHESYAEPSSILTDDSA